MIVSPGSLCVKCCTLLGVKTGLTIDRMSQLRNSQVSVVRWGRPKVQGHILCGKIYYTVQYVACICACMRYTLCKIFRYLSDRSDSHVANILWEKAQFATGLRWSERSRADFICKVLLLQ